MMNIMMVGHRGAGKTAFMAGLYHCRGDKKTAMVLPGHTRQIPKFCDNLHLIFLWDITQKQQIPHGKLSI